MVSISTARGAGAAVNNYEVSLSLGVRHPDVDPAQITRELGLQPGHAWRAGEARLDEAGTSMGGTHRGSYWFCEFAPRPTFSGESTLVESELTRVLHMLRKSIVFLQGLHYGGGTTELCISIFAHGDFRMELLPEETALLGRLGITTRFDIKPYPPPSAPATITQ
jgi:hypothetical protein